MRELIPGTVNLVKCLSQTEVINPRGEPTTAMFLNQYGNWVQILTFIYTDMCSFRPH